MEEQSALVDELVASAARGITADILKQLRVAKASVLNLENRHIRQISKVRLRPCLQESVATSLLTCVRYWLVKGHSRSA